MIDRAELQGRRALVTGGSDGLGKATAKALAAAGTAVTLVGRDPERGRRAAAELLALRGGGQVTFEAADVGCLASVRDLAAAFRSRNASLDVLVHAAGVIEMGRARTPEGIERNFAVNYLGRYLLTALLDDLFTPGARVIALATAGVQPLRFDFEGVTGSRPLSGFRAYQQSQAANDVWGVELAERLRARGVHVAVLAPGIFQTAIRRAPGTPWWLRALDRLASPFALTVEEGAKTPVGLALDPWTWPESTVFFGSHLRALETSAGALDSDTQSALREFSARLVSTVPTHPPAVNA